MHTFDSLNVRESDIHYITMVSPFKGRIDLVKHIREVMPRENGLPYPLDKAHVIAKHLLDNERVVAFPNPNLFEAAVSNTRAYASLPHAVVALRALSEKFMRSPLPLTTATDLTNALVNAGLIRIERTA